LPTQLQLLHCCRVVGSFYNDVLVFDGFKTLSLFLDPELVHEITDAYVDLALEVAQLAYKTGGVDTFHISDDWSGAGGLSNENKKLSHLVLSHEVDKINRHQNT